MVGLEPFKGFPEDPFIPGAEGCPSREQVRRHTNSVLVGFCHRRYWSQIWNVG